MYILEFLLKKIIGRKNKEAKHLEEKEYAKCEHIFLPIDKSGKRLACSKCGQYAVLE
ncbi:MAG: hypothetical protein WCF95_02350 [bacterium]